MIRTAFADASMKLPFCNGVGALDNLRSKINRLAAQIDASEANVLTFMVFPHGTAQHSALRL
ncbi:MAG: hypothetical protein ACR2QH_03570 [Geminicoccaceae bacterium]